MDVPKKESLPFKQDRVEKQGKDKQEKTGWQQGHPITRQDVILQFVFPKQKKPFSFNL